MEDSERQHRTRAEGARRSAWAGWPPGHESAGGTRARAVEFECVDFCPICRTADVLRATVPPEIQEHWSAWQRELLLAVRSLLDHYIEHVESGRRGTAPIQDIPIE